MSKEITCTYVATAPTAQSMSGTIKLTGCDPAIGNDQTLNSSDVIFIVAGIVLFGLVIQWAMLWLRRHLDNEALMTLRADLRTVRADLGHVVRVHPDGTAVVEPVVEPGKNDPAGSNDRKAAKARGQHV